MLPTIPPKRDVNPPRLVHFLRQLQARRAETFTLEELLAATHYGYGTASEHIARLIRAGMIHRLRPREYLVLRSLVGGKFRYQGIPYALTPHLVKGPYCISHRSAMELHGMARPSVPQVFVTTAHPVDECVLLGTRFRFVMYRPDFLFGITDHSLPQGQLVRVTDLERTLIDGLKHSRYCGGVAALLAGFHGRRDEVDLDRLVTYARRLGKSTIMRRVGLLIELCGLADDAPGPLLKLQQWLGERTWSYQRLDTSRPALGANNPRWRLILNVTPAAIRQALSAVPPSSLQLPEEA